MNSPPRPDNLHPASSATGPLGFDSPPEAPCHAARRATRTILGSVVALLATTTFPAAATTITFDYTGTAQSWVVPAGISSITVDARGAQGQAGPLLGTGGLGGRVEAALTVSPGATIGVFVGGTSPRPTGGFNGGGAGGYGNNGGHGGGGGGASDLRVGGSTLAHRVLVAAGGGGAGVDARAGGAGGGLTGGQEVPPGEGCGVKNNGGCGGTQSGGGTAGRGLSCQGNAGQLGQGGAGGPGCNGAPGGGGGGYYGGGGAGSSEAGGGGSSLVPAGGTTTSGFQSGNGQITITYGSGDSCGGVLGASEECIFHDDFERSDSASVANGWTEVDGSNLKSDLSGGTLRMAQTGGLSAALDGENTRLSRALGARAGIVVRGSYTPIHAGPGGGQMHARVVVRSGGTAGSGQSCNSNTGCCNPGTCGPTVPPEGCRTHDGFGLVFLTDGLDIAPGGWVRIDDNGLEKAAVSYLFNNATTYAFELRIDENNHVEGRVWDSASGVRPETPTVAFDNAGSPYPTTASGDLFQIEVQNTNDDCGASHTISAVWDDISVASGAGGAACGDGRLDADEACDLGTAQNGSAGTCCTATCQYRGAGETCRSSTDVCDVAETCDGVTPTCPVNTQQPDGTACDDANICTNATTCTAGLCAGGNVTVCDSPCEICSPDAGGCAAAPRYDCKWVTTSCASRLKLFDNVTDRLDKLDWEWAAGERTTVADFDDPADGATGSGYALCVFDESTGTSSLLLAAEVAAGSGWRRLGTGGGRGFIWKGRTGASGDGLTMIQLRPGNDGKASVRVQGAGEALAMPALPLWPETTVQLQASGGACWEATFGTSSSCSTFRNTDSLFYGTGE